MHALDLLSRSCPSPPVPLAKGHPADCPQRRKSDVAANRSGRFRRKPLHPELRSSSLPSAHEHSLGLQRGKTPAFDQVAQSRDERSPVGSVAHSFAARLAGNHLAEAISLTRQQILS